MKLVTITIKDSRVNVEQIVSYSYLSYDKVTNVRFSNGEAMSYPGTVEQLEQEIEAAYKTAGK